MTVSRGTGHSVEALVELRSYLEIPAIFSMQLRGTIGLIPPVSIA